MDNPIYLWALPALLLPFLLRWIRPPQPLKVAFSQMYLIDKVLKKAPLPRKSNPWLLYLIRVLTVLMLLLLVVGAFTWSSGASGTRQAFIFLVDDTYHASQQDRDGVSYWDHYLDRIEKEVASAGVGSAVSALGYSGKVMHWTQSGTFMKTLRSWPQGGAREKWMRVRQNLRMLCRSREHEALSVVVVGDGYAEDKRGLVQALQALPDIANVQFEPIAMEKIHNVSLKAEIIATPTGVVYSGSVYAKQGNQQLRLRAHSMTGKRRTLN